MVNGETTLALSARHRPFLSFGCAGCSQIPSFTPDPVMCINSA